MQKSYFNTKYYKMSNKDIRPEWVPSAYREEPKAEKKTGVKAVLYAGKGINAKQGFKRKFIK